jgi:transcriptional regulator with XRE-family HTH domain
VPDDDDSGEKPGYDPDAVEAGRTIRAARARMGLTQEQFAVRAGMTRVTLSRVENGEEVQPRTLRAAMEAAGLDAGPTPARSLSDAELVREFERRWPGKISEILSGDPPRPRPPEDKPDETGQSA